MGRHICTDVPQVPKLFIPDWPHSKHFRELDEEYKAEQIRWHQVQSVGHMTNYPASCRNVVYAGLVECNSEETDEYRLRLNGATLLEIFSAGIMNGMTKFLWYVLRFIKRCIECFKLSVCIYLVRVRWKHGHRKHGEGGNKQGLPVLWPHVVPIDAPQILMNRFKCLFVCFYHTHTVSLTVRTMLERFWCPYGTK